MQERTNDALTPRELIRCLLNLRFLAKRSILNLRATREALESQERIQANLPPSLPEWADAAQLAAILKEGELDLKFRQIEIGQQLMCLCSLLDEKVTREDVFDALNTNQADRDTDRVRQFGQKTIHLIAVLDLENSATKDDNIETRPLKWCQTMAMLHAMNTNSKLDRAIHEEANEFFGGIFGDYQERSFVSRLTGV